VLLPQLLGHRVLLLDHQLDLRRLLRHVDRTLGVLEFADLVLVHLDALVSVRQLLGQHLEVVLRLENRLALARTLLLLETLKFLLHRTLDLYQLGFQLGVLQLEGTDQLVLRIELRRTVYEERSVDKLVIHQSINILKHNYIISSPLKYTIQPHHTLSHWSR
jgi:hypothetical protein